MHCSAFIASSGDKQNLFSVVCVAIWAMDLHGPDPVSPAVPGSLLGRAPTFVSVLPWLVWLNPKCWRISQSDQFPLSLLGFAQSRVMNHFCTHSPTLVLAKAVASLLHLERLSPWISKVWCAGLLVTPPVLKQGSSGWQNKLVVWWGHGWRQLKWFVALPWIFPYQICSVYLEKHSSSNCQHYKHDLASKKLQALLSASK